MPRIAFPTSRIVEEVTVNGPGTVSELVDRLRPVAGISDRRLKDLIYRVHRAGRLVIIGRKPVAKTVVNVYGVPGQTAEQCGLALQWHFAEFRTSVYDALRASERPMTAPGLCEALLDTRDQREVERVRSALRYLAKVGLVTSRPWFGGTTLWEAVV